MTGSPVFSINFTNRLIPAKPINSKLKLHTHPGKPFYFYSVPEARDSTKACRFFPPVFSRGRMKGQDSMTSLVTPCFEKKFVTSIQRLTKTKYEIPQNRLLGSGSRHTIVCFSWDESIGEIYWKYRTAGHLVFWKPWPAVELKKSQNITSTSTSSSQPSVNQTLDLRSIKHQKHFRIAWLFLIDIR